MNGYLLDTNAVCKWFQNHANVVAHVNALPGNLPLVISAVTLGEIECGHYRSAGTNPSRRKSFEVWVSQTFPFPLPITRHTSSIYGQLKASIFNRHPPPRKSRQVENCYDKVSGRELGIDENDLWIAAQAIEHKLVLVTNDRMRHILDGAGNTLLREDWELPI
ncbi:MAG TPA: PIN domain-containing protein [Pirellulales bacterium]|nr:PIN domain-containing protein [Pirellulales bacterium]